MSHFSIRGVVFSFTKDILWLGKTLLVAVQSGFGREQDLRLHLLSSLYTCYDVFHSECTDQCTLVIYFSVLLHPERRRFWFEKAAPTHQGP